MVIVKEIKKILRNYKIKKIKDNLQLSPHSTYGFNFNVEIREIINNRKYLTVGENCSIDANFIFERKYAYINIGDRTHIGGEVNIY